MDQNEHIVGPVWKRFFIRWVKHCLLLCTTSCPLFRLHGQRKIFDSCIAMFVKYPKYIANSFNSNHDIESIDHYLLQIH